MLRGVLVLLFALAFAHATLINVNIDRTLDLTSSVVRSTSEITLKNSGSSSVDSFEVHVLAIHGSKATAFAAVQGETNLKVSQVKDSNVHQVDLSEPLAAGAEVTVTVTYAITHALSPLPKSVAQSENQFMVYSDSHYFYTPYATESQTLTVITGTTNIESLTELSPFEVKENGDVVFGPYTAVVAGDVSEFQIHYQNNAPFITVSSLIKEIELSNWGNLAVEETYELKHDGAKLKGQFNRYDYMRSRNFAPAHIPVMTQHLPLDASDIYYRDSIGNITTSHTRYEADEVTLELLPRYPLFGGWKAAFYMGYNLPLYNYLFSDYDTGKYVLKVPFYTNFDHAVTDYLEVRVILPEGAKDIDIHVPFDVSNQKTYSHFTYLDTAGRPVIAVEKTNVVSEYNQEFYVTYRFSSTSMLQEPLLLIGAYFAIFALVMLYSRIDISIGAKSRPDVMTAETEAVLLKVRGIVDHIQTASSQFDADFAKCGNKHDYNKVKTQANNAFHKYKHQLNRNVDALEKLDLAIYRKVSDLRKKIEDREAVQNQLHTLQLEIRFGNAKPAVSDQKESVERRYNAVDNAVDRLSSYLFDYLE